MDTRDTVVAPVADKPIKAKRPRTPAQIASLKKAREAKRVKAEAKAAANTKTLAKLFTHVLMSYDK